MKTEEYMDELSIKYVNADIISNGILSKKKQRAVST